MTLLLIRESRGMRTMKIRLVIVIVPVAFGALVVAGTTSVTAKTRVVLLLGKMSRGQQRWICSQGWKRSLMQKLMSKKMVVKVRV
jgi:hypothetical protein